MNTLLIFDAFGGRQSVIAEISIILRLLLRFKLPFSNPFWNNLNYASIANIVEVVKFY